MLLISSNCTCVLAIVLQGIQWSGPLNVQQVQDSTTSISLWWPATSAEHLFYLPVRAKISPGLYRALKYTSLAIKKDTKYTKDKKSTTNSDKMDDITVATNAQDFPQDSLSVPQILGISLDPLSPPLLSSDSPPEPPQKPQEIGGKLGFKEASLGMGLGGGCQLIFPEPWIGFWRWHGEAQVPQVVSTEEGGVDPEAYDFSQTCRRGTDLGV